MKLFERQFLRPIFDALQDQVEPVVKILRNKGVEAAINSLDTIEINSHLAPPIRDIYATAGLYFANKTIWDLRQSAKGVPQTKGVMDGDKWIVYGDYGPELFIGSESKASFGFNDEFIRDILAFFSKYLLNQAVLPISETTRQQILEVLNEGVSQGWGVDKMANILESPEFTLWRARLIVRTESNKAMNYGQRLGESKSQWESTKRWVAANDHRTRHSHRLVDDQILDFNERFLVPIFSGRKPYLQQGVDLMTGPGDVHASAGNICNCRCTLAFEAKRDANGRLIRKTNSPVWQSA